MPRYSDLAPTLDIRELPPIKLLSAYIKVVAEEKHDGYVMRIQETGLDKPGAQLMLFVEKGTMMGAEQRKTYLKYILERAFRDFDHLFEGCEDADCPQCGGHKAKVL